MAIPDSHEDADVPPLKAGASVVAISAVTLVTADMVRAVRFYEALGFVRKCGGPQAPFTSFAVGGNYLNIATKTKATSLTRTARTTIRSRLRVPSMR